MIIALNTKKTVLMTTIGICFLGKYSTLIWFYQRTNKTSSYSRLVIRRVQVLQQVQNESLRQTSKTISQKLVKKQRKQLGQSEQQQNEYESTTNSCDGHKHDIEDDYAQCSQSKQAKHHAFTSFVVELERWCEKLTCRRVARARLELLESSDSIVGNCFGLNRIGCLYAIEHVGPARKLKVF